MRRKKNEGKKKKGKKKREERGKGRRAIVGPWPAIYIKQVTTRSSTRTTSEKGRANGGGRRGGREEAMSKVGFRGRGATQCKASRQRRAPGASPQRSHSRVGGLSPTALWRKENGGCLLRRPFSGQSYLRLRGGTGRLSRAIG